mgnify:CR=1 FL=1
MRALLVAAWLAMMAGGQSPPKSPPLSPRPDAAARVKQLMKDGEAARQAELLDEAIRICGEVVKLVPRNAEAW